MNLFLKSVAPVAFALAIMFPDASQAFQSSPETEEFSPNGDVTGTGWMQIYNPTTNTVDVLPYSVIDGMAIYDGDIILGAATGFNPASKDVNAGQSSIAITSLGRRWDDGIVYYDLNDHEGSETILEGMALIEEKTPIEFVERTDQESYVRFVDGSGCSSFVGRLNGRAQDINLKVPGCVWRGIVAHELFHALGFLHEQSRSDRDEHVIINFENIQDGKEGNFQKANASSTVDLGPYDFNSIMHYSKRAFSKNGEDTITTIPEGTPIGNRDDLSEGDIAGMYAAYFADLQVEIESQSQANANEELALTVSVTNLRDSDIGSILVDDIRLSFPLPVLGSYSGHSGNDAWECETATDRVDCTLAGLDRDAESELVLNFVAPGQSGDMDLSLSVDAKNADPAIENNTASFTVTVINNPPTLAILQPALTSEVFDDETVNLAGSATDAEDGDIASAISWSSSLDGDLGSGASVNIPMLSIGTHTITATVADSEGASASADVQIVVVERPNAPPTIDITAPGNASSHTEGASLNMTGTATDNEDGNISTSIVWSSDVDGDIGTGASVQSASLRLGPHVITASITDSEGAVATATRSITIIERVTSPLSTESSSGGGASGLPLLILLAIAGLARRMRSFA